IAGQPDNSHSASAQNLNERVAAEQSLSADKLTLRHVRRAAGLLALHPTRIILEETAIKPKAANEWSLLHPAHQILACTRTVPMGRATLESEDVEAAVLSSMPSQNRPRRPASRTSPKRLT